MFDLKSTIRVGEIQVQELDARMKLLYTRGLNPAETILNWCNNQGYEWLSLPQAVKEIGFKKILALAPESHELHWQRATLPSAFGDQERISPSLTFNSYIITQGTIGKRPEEDNFNVYAGHVLPLKIEEIGAGYRQYPPTLRLTDLSQFNQITDIKEGFGISGLDGIGWSEANLVSGNLETALFGVPIQGKVLSKGKIYIPLPGAEHQLCTLDLDSSGSITAWTFYHRSYEFANKAIVRKKDVRLHRDW